MKNSLLNFNKIFLPERNMTLYDFTEKAMRDIPQKYKDDSTYYESVQVEDSCTPDILSYVYYDGTSEWDIVCLENNIDPLYELPKSQAVLEKRVDDLLKKWSERFLPIVSQNLTEEEIAKKVAQKREFFYKIVEKENENKRNLKFVKKNYMIFMYDDISKKIKTFVEPVINGYPPVFIEGNEKIDSVVIAVPIDSKNLYNEYDLLVYENQTTNTVYDISTILGIVSNGSSVNYSTFTSNLINLTGLTFNQYSHKQFNVYETDIHSNMSFSLSIDNAATVSKSLTPSASETSDSFYSKLVSLLPELEVTFFDNNLTKSITQTNATNIPYASEYHKIVRLNDGRLLLSGGTLPANPFGAAITSTYFGTITGNNITWTSGTDLPVGLFGHTCDVLSDGRILIVGGTSSFPTGSTKTYFGTITGNNITWTTGTDLPIGVFWHKTAILPDNRIVVVGGATKDSPNGIASTYFGTISGNTITWTSGTDLPIAIARHDMCAIKDGRLFITGGVSGSNNLSSVYFGSISGNNITWNTGTNLPTASEGHTSTLLADGRVFIQRFGFVDICSITGTKITYDSFSSISSKYSSAILLPDSSVLITGGNTGTDAVNNTYILKLKELARFKLKSLSETSSFMTSSTTNFEMLKPAYTLVLNYTATTFSIELNGFDVIIRAKSGNITNDVNYFIEELAKRSITATNISDTIVIPSTASSITNLENIDITYQTQQQKQLAYVDVEYNYIPKYQIITITLNSTISGEETFSIYLNNITYTYTKASNETVDASILMNKITDEGFTKTLLNSTSFTLSNKYLSRRNLITASNNISISESFQ